MSRLFKFLALLTLAFMVTSFAEARTAVAQVPVTTYYSAAPTVHYLPVRRGLFGLRRGYVPVVSSAAPVAVTSYYAPAPPVMTYHAPVTTYYAPAAVTTTYYAPAAPVTTYYAPAAPVTTYYAPAAPASVTTYYPGVTVAAP